MGICSSGPSQEFKASAERSKKLEAMNKKTFQAEKQKVKLLLLGAGESGKSTFFKQMKIINLNGYSDKEREDFKKIVYSNILGNAVALLEGSQKLGVAISPDNKEAAQRVFSVDAAQDFGENGLTVLVPDLKKLWSDPGIQTCYTRSSEFQLNDSTDYFFQNLDRIVQKDYIPNVDDILRIRIKTSGITEIDFNVGKDKFVVVDVGGQRSERRKWIHCFQDVTAIIFFAALSEYDQKLSEEETTNRMSEALKLFKELSNYKCFAEKDTAIILFLNKYDLFTRKIERVPLKEYFPQYTGSSDADEASDYIKQKFLECSPPNKQIYVHKTTATDTDNIKHVFRAVKDIIVSAYLKTMGLLDYSIMEQPAPVKKQPRTDSVPVLQ